MNEQDTGMSHENDDTLVTERRVLKLRDVNRATVPLQALDLVSPSSHTEAGYIPGLFIVYGGAASNKSKMLSTLADILVKDDKPHQFVYAGEPDPRSIGSWAETVSIMKYGFVNSDSSTILPELILIDSLKDLLYAPSSEGAGSGGLSTEAIRELSNISAQCMREKRTIIAVINPTQPKFMEDWYETIKTNVTGIFHLNYTTFDQGKGDKDLALVKNFVAVESGTTRSSFRFWNGEFYERISNAPVTSLLGYRSNSVDGKQDSMADVEAVSASNFSNVKGLQHRIFSKLMATTPTNQIQDFDDV